MAVGSGEVCNACTEVVGESSFAAGLPSGLR